MRLYIDTPSYARPLSARASYDSTNSDGKQRLFLCGHTARLAPRRERFEDAPATTTAVVNGSGSSGHHPYRLDIGGVSLTTTRGGDDKNKNDTSTSLSARSTNNNSTKRPLFHNNSNVRRHTKTASMRPQSATTARQLEDRNRDLLDQDRRRQQQQQQEDHQQHHNRPASGSGKKSKNSSSFFPKNEVAWFSGFVHAPAAVSVGDRRNFAQLAEFQSGPKIPTTSRATSSGREDNNNKDDAADQYQRQVLSRYLADSASAGKVLPSEKPALVGPAELGNTFLQHRSISPSSACFHHHNQTHHDEEVGDRETQEKQAASEEEETTSIRLTSVGASPSYSNNNNHTNNTTTVLITPRPPSSLSSSRATPRPKQHQNQSTAKMFSAHHAADDDNSITDPRLRASRAVLDNALRAGEDSKYGRRVWKQLQAVSHAARLEAEASRTAASTSSAMVGFDRGGGFILRRPAIVVSGSHVSIPQFHERKRPQSAPRNPVIKQMRQERAAATEVHSLTTEEKERMLAEQERRRERQRRGRGCAGDEDDDTRGGTFDPMTGRRVLGANMMSYVTAVPGVFRAGLMAAPNKEVAVSCLRETSAYKPLRVSERNDVVPVPVEYSPTKL